MGALASAATTKVKGRVAPSVSVRCSSSSSLYFFPSLLLDDIFKSTETPAEGGQHSFCPVRLLVDSITAFQ